MSKIIISSGMGVVGSFPCNYPDEVVKNEPMFFRSSFDYAYENEGW